MRFLWKMVVVSIVVVLAGCASQDSVDTEPGDAMAEESAAPSEPTETAEETTPQAPVAEESAEIEVTSTLLASAGIAGFTTGDGTAVAPTSSVTLTTGGAASGRLVPSSSSEEVSLYMTRDGSVPSATNNWGGAIDPASPPLVTRKLEGSGVYKIVAEKDGEYSETTTVYVSWQHEESPALDAPTFEVAGRQVRGSVELPVSDGTNKSARLYIASEYVEAVLYISRDGSDPNQETFWKSQTADGTYLFSPDPTAAAYRVIAVWQESVSPVASLNVTWVE